MRTLGAWFVTMICGWAILEGVDGFRKLLKHRERS
jgi:hypothetical protein